MIQCRDEELGLWSQMILDLNPSFATYQCWSSESDLTSLSLSFLICKVRIMALTLEVCCKDQKR